MTDALYPVPAGWAEKALIDSDTSWMLSARRVAVTMISSSPPADCADAVPPAIVRAAETAAARVGEPSLRGTLLAFTM